MHAGTIISLVFIRKKERGAMFQKLFTCHIMSFVIALFSYYASHAATSQKTFHYETIKKMPKIELHMHLGGSYPLSYLKEIASSEQYQALIDEIEKIKKRVDYHAVFSVFKLVANIVNTPQKVENGVAALCKELAEDNVVYAELRTGLKDLGTGFEGYL